MPQTPLGERTELPKTSKLHLMGPTSNERGREKKIEGKEWDEKERGIG